MLFPKLPLLSLSLLPLLASSTPILLPRQCVDNCGSTCYYQSDINAAVVQGYNYYKQGKQVGSNKYPHTETNYEGFKFPTAGPYEEFPILKSYKVYTGGDPGPDRVVFSTSGRFEGLVTHTGASGNDFVQCRVD